jgi:hypothetical protein
MNEHRRRVLALLGTTGVTTLTGCGSGNDDNGDTPTEGQDRDTDTPTPTYVPPPWGTPRSKIKN